MKNRTYLLPPFAVPYGVGDYVKGVSALFRYSASAPDPLKELFGDRALFWTGSGRQALWLILQALHLPKGAGIGVPLFGSSSVAVTIHGAGFKPIFLDVSESTLTLNPAEVKRVAGRISALVVEHLFGHVAAIDQILEAAPGIPVIEDTAQAPLTLLNGRLAGTFGAASFYSFASSKYLPAAGGGLAAINNAALAAEVAIQTRQLTRPGTVLEFRSTLMQAVKAALFRPPLYGLFGISLRSSTEEHSRFAAQMDHIAISRASARVVLRQAQAFAVRVQEQRSNSLLLLKQLAGIERVTLPHEPAGAMYNRYLFPVLVADREERDAVRAGMRKRGIDTTRIHFNSPDNAVALGYRGGCQVSERVASTLLTLPNHAGLTVREVERVAKSFRAALAEHRSSKFATHAGRNRLVRNVLERKSVGS
ncbi:MAG: DegT/DnrJ/EryC1/StrS family aminotransferase [Bryobacteraceae bacterium]